MLLSCYMAKKSVDYYNNIQDKNKKEYFNETYNSISLGVENAFAIFFILVSIIFLIAEFIILLF